MTRKEKARAVLDRLSDAIPEPETELAYRTPFELLIAVILSAQCTDKRVNMITPALFESYPTPELMARASADEILPFIASISFPNNKAKALAKTARMLVDDFGGEVPRAHSDLVKLAGVGRKTANVVVSVAFGQAAIAVDTHVFRVANRIGIVKDKATPDAVEKGLRRAIPREEWADAHHLFILHGRYTCLARSPTCGVCPVTDLCDYYAALESLPADLEGLDPKQGRYFSKTAGRYFDEPASKTDRRGVEQIADPWSGSMNVYDSRTGRTTKRVKDYRI
ncbi:endonuclease III [Rubrivirga sp.]|uniref:endonuclease III n=1 Tax=Rubrivirga sp. TaxID=1885344 RepID=UPI003C762207